MLKTTLALAVLTLSLTAATKAPPATPAAEESCCKGEPSSAVSISAPATQPAIAGHQDAAALFQKMKATLVGTWTGTDSEGSAAKLEYQVTGNGSAIMEVDPSHGGMLTIWTLDKDRVLMTHYCAARNQPRMAATGMTDGTAKFDFIDVSGMKSADDVHMHEVAISFTADGKVQQTWTLFKGGKAIGTEKITMSPEK